MVKFASECEDLWLHIANFNDDVFNKHVPNLLQKMPLPLAIMAWLLFCLCWIIIAPFTLVIEAPLVIIAAIGDYTKDHKLNHLTMILTDLLIFIFARVAACKITFEDGVVRNTK